MKTQLTLCLLAIIIILTSCNGEKKRLEEENKILKEQNELLTKCIVKVIRKIKDNCRDTSDEEGHSMVDIPKDTIIGGIKALRADKKLRVPTSWKLESAQLLNMVTHSEGNIMADGILAFPIDSADHLKIALIPYYYDDNNQLKLIYSEFMAYDYSDMCPVNCPVNLSEVLEVKDAYQDFDK